MKLYSHHNNDTMARSSQCHKYWWLLSPNTSWGLSFNPYTYWKWKRVEKLKLQWSSLRIFNPTAWPITDKKGEKKNYEFEWSSRGIFSPTAWPTTDNHAGKYCTECSLSVASVSSRSSFIQPLVAQGCRASHGLLKWGCSCRIPSTGRTQSFHS